MFLYLQTLEEGFYLPNIEMRKTSNNSILCNVQMRVLLRSENSEIWVNLRLTYPEFMDQKGVKNKTTIFLNLVKINVNQKFMWSCSNHADPGISFSPSPNFKTTNSQSHTSRENTRGSHNKSLLPSRIIYSAAVWAVKNLLL